MIKWGILGAGNIAHRFAASLQHLDNCELCAISGRSQEKVSAFAETYSCQKAYLDYDELLQDPDIDAIYLSLPHGLHCEWAIKALSAHKAVLCEKPATLNAEQMREIKKCALEHGVLFMEAMKTRFTPIYRQTKELVAEGVIGELNSINASLCVALPQEYYGKTYHTDPTQGGCLWDSGIYCASWLEDYTTGEVQLEKVNTNLYQGIDLYVNAALRIGEMKASLETAFDRNKAKTVILRGTKGWIEIPDLHRPIKAVVYEEGKDCREIVIEYVHDDFYGEIHHFCDCLLLGKMESDIMPLDASVRCAEILDTIRDGFTKYDADDLLVLEDQERALGFEQFTAADALKLGNLLIALDGRYDLPVAVRIVSEKDGSVLFQHIMDGKTEKNIRYAELKRQAVLRTGHSSAWATIKHQIDADAFADQQGYILSGGAFPIKVDGELAATVAVSGLHEGKDHELVINALSGFLKVSGIKQFQKAMF